MALEVRHRIHRGFEVKPNAGFSPQQSQQQQQQQQQQRQQQQQPRGAAAAPQEARAQSIDAGPRLRKESSHLHSASLSAKAPFSPAAREREPDGFHDWHPHGYSVSRPKHNSTAAAASAPAGRGTWLPDSERSDVGVRGFVSMCSAARSIAAVDSPTTLRQHRVEVCAWVPAYCCNGAHGIDASAVAAVIVPRAVSGPIDVRVAVLFIRVVAARSSARIAPQRV